MEAAGPVYDNVGAVLIESARASDGAGGVELTELEKAVKDGAVFPYVEALQLADVVLHVVRRDDTKEVNVVVGVESRHRGRAHEARPENLHSSVQPIVHHEIVSHADSMRLHRVTLAIVVIAHLGIVEVGNPAAVRGHDRGSSRLLTAPVCVWN